MAAVKKIAIISGSTRAIRLGPGVAKYVQSQIVPHLGNHQVDIIDVADQNLPIFDEPELPGSLPKEDPTPHYAHEHTRKWSAIIKPYDAYVFVTPQYNWSMPASLKNALDFLFHEWAGKVAGIVSYGGRGGGRAAAHLNDVLEGLSMKRLSVSPGLSTSRKMQPYITEHKDVSDVDRARWKEQGTDVQIEKLAKELAEALEKA